MELTTVTSTPAVTLARPKAAAYSPEWTPGCRSALDSQSSEDDELAEIAGKLTMLAFNAAKEELNQVATSAGRVSPLMFRLKTTWDEAKEHEKQVCIDKATEACSLVCDIIAPKAGQELFQSCFTPDKESGSTFSSAKKSSSNP